MHYISHYPSPLGDILLSSDGSQLTGLWFEGQKYHALYLGQDYAEKDLPVFSDTRRWLDIYFSGEEPDFIPPLRFSGTPFQNAVWKILAEIPYGSTMTYGEIAKRIAIQMGLARMSAQAVGGAVGRNPISILVPCHRVVGSNGSLTGYAGGIQRKTALLSLEQGSWTR